MNRNYTIISGRFETGTPEQKNAFMQLFGKEETRNFFDLYFHWYNLVHEIGHCLVDQQEVSMSGVLEEMWVNRMAVAYFRCLHDKERLATLYRRLDMIVQAIPSPVPNNVTFETFYENIWETERINDVMTYGYFQLNSILKALNGKEDLERVLSEIGLSIKNAVAISPCQEPIDSEHAENHLTAAIKNMQRLGVNVPNISIRLVDDPSEQRVEYSEA